MLSTSFRLAALFLGLAGGAVLHKKADISTVPASAWSDLNNTVQGRLHAEYPVGAFCYAQYEGALNPHIDLAQCAQLLASGQDTKFMAQYAQGYSYSTWPMCIAKNESCNTQGTRLSNPLLPLTGNCQQGSIPDYYIYAEHDGEIQAGLAFAKKYNIPLVIKSSGHDYKGRSAGQGALKIWMANYKFDMQYAADFQPAGSSQGMGPAITFNAGHSMEDVLKFADQNGGAVQAATAMSVRPAGGFLQGGGHSPLSVTYGLAVDNTLEIRGIQPDGTPFTASRQQNQDLFFALRGGGPGTFGVVTQVTARLHPTPSHGYQFAQVILAGLTDQSAADLLKVLIANAEQWAKDGWGGYAFPALTTNHSSIVILATPKLTLVQAQKSLAPLTDFVSTLTQGTVTTNVLVTSPNYLTLWNEMATIADNLQGSGVSLSSRLVPVDNFRGAQNQQNLFNAISPIMNAFGPLANKPLFMCLTAPYGYDAGDDAKTSSVTPAWRNALWHVIAVDEWDPTESQDNIEAEFKKTHDIIQPLVKLTPGSGAYQNEADTLESDPIGAYWGQDNYNKLLSIKKKYDPSNVLTCWQCVGWNSADSRYSCYPDGQ